MAKDLNVSLGLIAENFKRGLKQATRDLRRFARQTESIGQSLTRGLSVPLAGAGAAALKSAADFDRLRAQLVSVVGDADLAAGQIDRLRKIAEQPGLGFEQAVQASARLQALNLSAEQAEATIQAFGKAVARSGGGAVEFDGAVTALGQIISKGKISAEEINQLNERIFEIRPALEAAFGTSNSEELQRLGISAEEFVAKVTKEFSKLPPVQQNLFTAFENLQIGVKAFFAEIGAGINEVFDVQGAIESFTAFLGRLADRFRELDPNVKRTILQIAGLAIAIGPVTLGISALASGLATFLNPIGLVVAGIAALSAAFISLYNNNETFRTGIQKLGSYLKAVFSVVIESIGNLFRAWSPVLQVIGDYVRGLVQNFGQLRIAGVPSITAIGDALKFLGQSALIVFRVFNGLRVGVVGIFKELVEIARETVRSFQASFAALREGDFTEAFKNLGQGLKNLNPVSLAITEGRRLGGAFLDSFKDGFKNDPISGFFDKVKKKVEEQSRKTVEAAQEAGAQAATGAIDLPFQENFERDTQLDKGALREDRSRLKYFENLPGEFEDLISQAEQLRLLTETRGLSESDYFPAEQLENLQKGIQATTELQARQEKYNKSLAAAKGLTSLFAPAFEDMFKVIQNGGKNAFGAFAEAIKNILIELGKAIAKALVFAGITAILTGGASTFASSFKSLFGQFSGLGSVIPLANGGIIPNRTFLTGEEGAEAIIPLDRETNIPVNIEVSDIILEGTQLRLLMQQSEGVTNRLFG